jgi:hypothetical protein
LKDEESILIETMHTKSQIEVFEHRKQVNQEKKRELEQRLIDEKRSVERVQSLFDSSCLRSNAGDDGLRDTFVTSAPTDAIVKEGSDS